MIGGTIPQERKHCAGHGQIKWIDFIEAEKNARPAIGGGHSRAQTDDSGAHGGTLLEIPHGPSHSRLGAIVAGGRAPLLGSENLLAMEDGSVNQLPLASLL